MYAECHVLSRLHNNCCYRKAELLTVEKRSMLRWKGNIGCRLHSCQATKYFMLLSTIMSIQYYECVGVYYSVLS